MKKETLQRVEEEIAAGKLGIARDRLHGLIVSYPDDLSLRSRLGDVYWKLGYPAEAGRFWFLDSSLSSEQEEAVEAFLRSCGNDAKEIMKRLRLRSEVAGLGMDAAARLQELLQKTGARLPPSRSAPVAEGNRGASCMMFGCLILAIAFLALAIIGLATVLDFLRGIRVALILSNRELTQVSPPPIAEGSLKALAS